MTNWSLLAGVSNPAPKLIGTTHYTRGPEVAGLSSFYGTMIRVSSESGPPPELALSDEAVPLSPQLGQQPGRG